MFDNQLNAVDIANALFFFVLIMPLLYIVFDIFREGLKAKRDEDERIRRQVPTVYRKDPFDR